MPPSYFAHFSLRHEMGIISGHKATSVEDGDMLDIIRPTFITFLASEAHSPQDA